MRIAFFALLLICPSLWAQPAPEQLLEPFHWRNIGPANMGGRVVDVEAVNSDFTHVYLASASGGVWKSANAGTTWEPIFDDYGAASIGDIALFQPDPDILWVGTGEANNRNSVSWGNGVYRSVDGGATFAHLGLESTHQIARIITHPSDPDIAYVCAIGHLWGYSGERGLFLTRDGGASWQKQTTGLPDDGKTGCTDLVMHPADPLTLYAAYYERIRKPWIFLSGGSNGGIFKSTDGGDSWQQLEEGLPSGDTGRIGLAISASQPDILVALVEAERTDDLSRPGSGLYRSEDAGQSWTYVNTYNNRPFYYSKVRINPQDPDRVYLLTTRFMMSEDGGKTLRNGSEDQEVHGDFHAMWLDPTNPDRFYLGADKGFSLTHDHGQHYQLIDNLPIAQYYRIGVDMRDPYYVYGGLQDNGTFGGPVFSRDARGILNDANWKLHWGDGQHVQVDPTDWTTLFTEMENGRLFRYEVPSRSMRSIRPLASNITNYEEALSPDRLHGEPPLRFNWSSPMWMSPHDPKTLYLAGNYVFKSTNQGQTWTIVSPDLSTADPKKIRAGISGGITPDNSGAETHGTISTLALSPVSPAILWAGTDDGLVHVTRDGGTTWIPVRDKIPTVPEGLWVSRIEASHFNAGTAYITFDGHRSDQFEPWVFKTTDFGQSWSSISSGLPEGEVVRVIREDHRNPNLLFLGTEFSVFASLDSGESWHRLVNNMPTVATLDLVIHPRDNDLVAGTHGRSIWVMDDITPLQQLRPEVINQPAYLFEQRPATLWENVSRGGQRGHFWFGGENPPTIELTNSLPRAEFTNTAIINYYIGQPAESAPMLTIRSLDGQHKRVVAVDGQSGIHRFRWDLIFDVPPLSSAEKEDIDTRFTTLLETTGGGFLRAAYARFQQAQTPRQEREALEILNSGFYGPPLATSYALPRAGAGTYLLTLEVDGRAYHGALTIRPDPLMKR